MKQYTKMKYSGVEWIGDIPEGWNTTKFKFEYNIKKGALPTNQFNEKNSEVLPYLTTKSLRAESHHIFVKKDDGVNVNEKDLLILWDGHNAGEIFKGKIGILSSTMGVLLKIGNKSTSNYLFYLLKVLEKEIKNNTIGMGIPHVDGNYLKNLQIVIPSKIEQDKIYNFLNQQTTHFDELIAKSKSQIIMLEEKRHAAITQAVTKGLDPFVPMKDSGVDWIGNIPESWKIRKISHSVNKITNGYVGATRDIYVNDGIRYLQSLHVKKGKINFFKEYLVSESWSNVHSKSILKEGDVLVVQTGAYTGECAAVTKEHENCNCHALIIIQIKKEYGDGFFLSYLLRSNYGVNMINSLKTGALHPHLEIGYLKDVFLPLPSIKEQKDIVNYLDEKIKKIDALILKIKFLIQNLNETKQSMILEVVTGKIDVRGVMA
jgi:type I restriction enzyme, S subunit